MHKLIPIWLALLVVLTVCLGFLLSSRPVQAAGTSNTINFQARLLTANGEIVPDGNYNIDFKLYSADSTTGTVGSCTGACLWEETHTNAASTPVVVKDGYLSVSLGNQVGDPFPSTINWDNKLYLTMNVGGTSPGTVTWDGEMQNGGHSILLTAVPYAFRAGSLAFLSGSNEATLQFNSLINQNTTVTLPDPGASTAIVCYQTAAACGFAPASGSSSYLAKGAQDSSTANVVGNLYTFTNSNAGAAGVLSLANSGTNSALVIAQSGTSEPSAGQALILANNNTTTPTGNLIDLQSKSISQFSVTAAGAVTALGSVTAVGVNSGSGLIQGTGGLTITGTTTLNSLSASAAAVCQNASKQIITCTGSSGTDPNLTLQAAYNNSAGAIATITTTASKGISIAAGAVPTADLLNITNAGQAVTTAGVNDLSLNYVGGAAAVEAEAGRIDLQPGTTSGGTWNGLRFVANATGPATGVTETGIKLEGPATTGGAGTYNAVNIASLGTVTTGGVVHGINITATNSQAAGTVRGIQLNNITAGGASEIGIDLGTGWDNLLTYNNGATILINGTGQWNLAQVSGQLVVGNGGTGAGSFTTNGVIFGNNTSALGVTAAGTTGQCLVATTGSAPTWGSCGAGFLQQVPATTAINNVAPTANSVIGLTVNGTSGTSAVAAIFNQANNTSPADTVQLNDTSTGTQTNDLLIARSGTGTTTNLLNLTNTSGTATNGLTFTGSMTDFINASTFSVTSTGVLTLGSGGNTVTLNPSSGGVSLAGTAEHGEKLVLNPEYAGTVLSSNGAGNDVGTMTSGFDGTQKENYYQWTTSQSSNQVYYVVVQIPLPSSWGGWNGSAPLTVDVNTSSTSNGTIAGTLLDTSGTAVTNWNSCSLTPTVANTWKTAGAGAAGTPAACNISSGTFAAGGVMTLELKLQAPTGGTTEIGNIILNYNGTF